MFKIPAMIARFVMGGIFVVFGLNGLMLVFTGAGFIPMPPPSDAMGAVMGGFMATGYLLPLVKILEVAGGLLLLAGRFKRLAIVLLAPIVVNIFCIHLFVEPSGFIMGAVLVTCTLLIILDEWDGFRSLLKA